MPTLLLLMPTLMPMRIRPLEPDDPDLDHAVALVARRMRATLVEVLGEERGTSLYTLEWLEARVRWHLSPDQCTGRVFLAEDPDGRVLGHTIVRVDTDQDGSAIGLFSTTYVEPGSRRAGVAQGLLARGEAWMRERGLARAVTYTDKDNIKLQQLYQDRGYTLSPMPEDFVALRMDL